MKKYLILLTVLCLAALLAFGVMADEAENFAVAVLSASNVEQPEANVTQAELNAVVNRLSAVYADGTPDTTVGTDTTLVTRANVVSALYNVVNGKADLTAINEVLGMVDIDPNDARYAACRAFMQAGIITGYDEYGSVGVDRNVKRYELALMVDRILNSDERVTKEYILYASDEPFYLIDNKLSSMQKNVYTHLHGWQYDYTGSKEKTLDNSYVNVLTDYFTDDDMSMSKFVETQNSGVLVFEAVYKVRFGDTLHFEFYDIDGNEVISAGWTYSSGTATRKSKAYVGDVVGTTEYTINNKDSKTESTTRLAIDLDNNKAKLWMNGDYIGEAAIADGSNIAKVRMATDVAGTGYVSFNSVHMYKNYEVNDVFRLETVGAAPADYTSSSATVQTLKSNPGNHVDDESLLITSGGYATKAIENPVGGKIIATAYVLADGSTGTFTLQTADGTVDVITAKTVDGTWTVNGTEVYTSDGAIWNQVRIEADLDNKTAMVRINGKKVVENLAISVKAKNISHVKLASESGSVYFDDVQLYQTHDYDDYCPEPQPISTNGYTLSMSVCNLWREGNHYGWDVISPYPELEPITGYYDEGIPEAMDWEIKFLTEHGITNYALCWYPNNRNASDGSEDLQPLKRSRMSEALHDGFFNAKYSDLMTFNLLFENAGYTNLYEFQNVIWPYMIEWYFKDPRYLTISNGDGTSEIVFTVYRIDSWIQMCGGTYTSSSSYSVGNCASVLATMESTLKNANITDRNGDKITGIVFNFSGSMYHEAYEAHKAAGGENIILYAWGSNLEIAGTPSMQEYYAAKNAAGAQADGLNFVALPAAGFNDIAWRDVRTRTMTGDEFKEMCDWYQSSEFTQYAYTSDSSVNALTKFVQFDTWNEYGEGHYIYPTVANNLSYVGTGYDYLDAIAESFCSGHDSSNDVTPTDAQKLRIGHLYPATGKYNIARQHDPDTVVDHPDFITLNGGTLTESNMDSFMDVSGHGEYGDDNGYWTYTSRNSSWGKHYYYEWNSSNNGVYMKESKKDPAIINFDDSQFSGTAASDIKYIRFKIKGSQDNISYKLYFKNTSMSAFAEEYTATFVIDSSGEYLLDTSTISNWTGTISGIRLDVCNLGVSIYIQEISFLGEDASDAHTAITIDDSLYTVCDYSEIRNKNYGIDESGTTHEVYIAAQQWQGLYQKLHIVYEYERATGKLSLETPNGTIIEFTEGSSTAYVNGTAKTLSRSVDNYDGAPVIPLVFILDNGGYTYTRSSRAIDIDVADVYKPTVVAVSNGDAETAVPSTLTAPSFSGQYNSQGVVTREADPTDSSNNAWFIAGTSTNKYVSIEFPFDYELGATYTLELDVYFEGFGENASTVADTSNIGVAIRNGTYGSNYTTYTSSSELGVGSLGSTAAGSWVHKTITFTCLPFVNQVDDGRIAIFAGGQSAGSAQFYIDNVVIS